MTFIDSHDISAAATAEVDVCLIGGGAAGIALALELVDSPLRVLVLEQGGLTADDASSPIYSVLPGREMALGLDSSMRWYFGGNTNNWLANCRPLEAPAFERRAWEPNSGWPITQHELLPYYERAQETLGLGDIDWYDPEKCRPHLTHPLLDLDPTVLVSRIVQTGRVPSLADLHRERLAAAENVQIALRAQVVQLRTDAAGERVSAVEMVDSAGRRMRIEAKVVVLAAGGVENARLLLASNDVKPQGLGNDRDLVGRFFMDHWYFDLPLADWKTGLDLGFYDFNTYGPQAVDGTSVWGQLELSEELRRSEQLPGFSLWFLRAPRGSASVTASKRFAASLVGLRPFEPGRDFRLMGTAPAEVPKYLLWTVARLGRAPADGYVLRVQIEQRPNARNRIFLSTSVDALGRPKPELTLGLEEGESQSYARALEAAAAVLGLDTSRVPKQFRLMLDGGRCGYFWHHMGTTRMDPDPDAGVVDPDGRVHGVANLFVAGSSVFPTSGTAGPTLTIVALALRLADYLVSGTGGLGLA